MAAPAHAHAHDITAVNLEIRVNALLAHITMLYEGLRLFRYNPGGENSHIKNNLIENLDATYGIAAIYNSQLVGLGRDAVPYELAAP